MYIPEWFEERLRRDFNGRFLIRWSEAMQAFRIHQRIARGISMTPARLHTKLQKLSEPLRDEFQYRLRTGTEVFVDIYPGGRACCPGCRSAVSLKRHTWEFAHCGVCEKDFKAVAYELGHLLLEQLRYLDFERGGHERILEAQDRSMAEFERVQRRDNRNYLEAIVKEDWNEIAGIQQVGWTPATESGVRFALPESDAS